LNLPRNGYRSRNILADVLLGINDGLDSALWCYAFAAVIYAGAMSIFMPVGVFTLLLGWALLSIFVTLTTRAELHMANIDEQGVVIMGAVAALLVALPGEEGAGSRSLATLLATMSITSLLVAASFYFVGRHGLSRLLELLPYPVICGFMAGIAWLLLDAGVTVAVGTGIGSELLDALQRDGNAQRLAITLVLGLGLLWAVNHIEQSWTLPGASLLIVLGFYAVVFAAGLQQEQLTAGGWLIRVSEGNPDALQILSTLSLADVDFAFIASVLPEIATVVFLLLLSASMSLSALNADSQHDLNTGQEFVRVSGGNFLCALVASPPGYTDVVASSLYREFGASSRWMPLTSSAVCILVAFLGTWIIGYVPVVLVAATIFLFAFQTAYEWMMLNVRQFGFWDSIVLWLILVTVVLVGFTQGILVGILLTLVLFVIRYGRISAIQSRHTLQFHRSSVERSPASNARLQELGSSVQVYKLRGFIFFGTANSILESIRSNPAVQDRSVRAILLDMCSVTDIDVSALNTFALMQTRLEKAGAVLVYAGLTPALADALRGLDAVSASASGDLLFDTTDLAVEHLEAMLLKGEMLGHDDRVLHDFLEALIDDPAKRKMLQGAMEPVTVQSGKVLFHQGDQDNGMFLLVRGSMSAYIEPDKGQRHRVRKFMPGSVIGELSAYLPAAQRTATLIADDDVELFRISSSNLNSLSEHDQQLAACIHELVARTLAERVSAMNQRLINELS
jgi:SulP family sulfate permease